MVAMQPTILTVAEEGDEAAAQAVITDLNGLEKELAELEWLRRTPLRQVVAERQGTDPGSLQWALARTVEAHIGRGLRSLGLLVDLAVPRG